MYYIKIFPHKTTISWIRILIWNYILNFYCPSNSGKILKETNEQILKKNDVIKMDVRTDIHTDRQTQIHWNLTKCGSMGWGQESKRSRTLWGASRWRRWVFRLQMWKNSISWTESRTGQNFWWRSHLYWTSCPINWVQQWCRHEE